jgi:hypothetical protein
MTKTNQFCLLLLQAQSRLPMEAVWYKNHENPNYCYPLLELYCCCQTKNSLKIKFLYHAALAMCTQPIHFQFFCHAAVLNETHVLKHVCALSRLDAAFSYAKKLNCHFVL